MSSLPSPPEAKERLVGSPVFKTGGGPQRPRRVRFPSASATSTFVDIGVAQPPSAAILGSYLGNIMSDNPVLDAIARFIDLDEWVGTPTAGVLVYEWINDEGCGVLGVRRKR